MASFAKVRTVSVRKDDTKKMEEEARKMEAKLEMLRRTMDVAAAESGKAAPGGAGADAGRWRSGSAAKPLTKGYVKGVLDSTTKPKRNGSQQRALSAGRSEDPAREGGGGGSSRASPRQPPQQGKFGDILGAEQERSPPVATTSSSSRAAANLQAAMQQQSSDSLEVEAFLASLNLDRYVSLFMEHGFDCMEVVQEMQESHMKDIGMAPGHVLKLRKKLAEMAPQPAAPPPAPVAPERGAEVSKGATARQVSFGSTEEVRLKSGAGTGTGTGGGLRDGDFNEDESAASFQEALRAWREGRAASGSTKPAADAGSGGPASSPKAAPGSFWSSVGDSEVDLVRCSTPLKPPTDATLPEAETQRGPDAGEEKLCCYQCYKQFFAKYSVERESILSDTGGNKVKRLCSEACAERWAAAEQAKAEAVRKRQEKLDKMQEMQRALEAERASTPAAAEEPSDGASQRSLVPAEASMAQAVA